MIIKARLMQLPIFFQNTFSGILKKKNDYEGYKDQDFTLDIVFPSPSIWNLSK